MKKEKWQIKGYCDKSTWVSPYIGWTYYPNEYKVIMFAFLCFQIDIIKYSPDYPNI